jgi:glycosyltransferase involved in cell wall biosynthesis
LRILYIHQYFATRNGKTGTRSYEFAKRLLAHGHRVTMLTSVSDLSDLQVDSRRRVQRLSIEGIDVIAVRVPYSQTMGVARRILSFLQFMLLSSWIACRQKGHDVVFATSTPLTVGVPGLLASWVLRRPLVFEVRDLWPEAPIQMGAIHNPLLIALLRGFERLVYRCSRHVVALSPGMADGVREAGTPQDKISVIPNCSDLDLFLPGDPVPSVVSRFELGARFVVTHAGSMGAANGLETLLDAAAVLQEQGQDDVVILIVGEGATAPGLQQIVHERGLRNVVFTGGMPRSEVASLLQSSDVCLALFRNLPVLATNSPNKLFDALAAGRAVIVNSNGWTRRLVESESVGRYAQPGDGISLAREILWLRDHPRERQAMARRARQVAEAQFDRLLLADRLEQVLCDAVGVESRQPKAAAASVPVVHNGPSEVPSTANEATGKRHRIPTALVAWLCFFAMTSAILGTPRAQVQTLPTTHWAYAELEHFERRGFIVLDGVRPWSRQHVRRLVEQLTAQDENYSEVERQRLRRLQQEFVLGGAPQQAALRYDRPVVSFHESEWSILGDVGVSGGGARSLGTDQGAAADGTAWGNSQLEAVVHYGEHFVYESRYDVSLQEEDGQRVDENFVSSRERNWKGLTSHNDRAYVAFDSEHFRVSLGRDQVSWGPRVGQELLATSGNPSMDALQARLRLGRMQLVSVAGVLSSQHDRRFGAHRLELDLGNVRLGFHEAVVYESTTFETTYLFPLSTYYGNQFNERQDDNVLLGADVRWSSPVGVLGCEFLMDDFIYDGDPAPHKLGISVGWDRAFVLWQTDLDVSLGYVALSRWLYTHRNATNAYATGSGTLGDDEASTLLGHALGPDADRLQCRLSWSPHVDWRLGASTSYTRRGEGNFDRSAWQTGTPYKLRFPSGDVVYETLVGGDVGVRVHPTTELRAAAALVHSTQGNLGQVAAEIRVDF